MDIISELEEAKNKLAIRTRDQEFMKKVNAAHKAYLKNPASLDKSDLSDSAKSTVRTYVPKYSFEPHPFPSYKLTNNGAEIRRLTKRVEELTSKAARAEAGNTVQEYGTLTVTFNYDEDRIQLEFPKDVYPKVKEELRGWNWSPTNTAWQRKITPDAKYCTERFVRIYQKLEAPAA